MENSIPPESPLPPLQNATVEIEEPKTLTQAQLAFFREEALKVIETRTPEEATRIFLAGSEIDGSSKQMEAAVDNNKAAAD